MSPSKKISQSIERPPIVAVLGHVDHGKSTLLDYVRKTNIVATEAGGITQHVAAYEVEHAGKRITFIDTPGHAAFQAIRARGANIADIAILVVAADDGVKAQTLEALESIKGAGIPFIVAINKIDKPNASLERTQASLLEHHIYLETLGGDIPWTAISAKAGTGITELLDLVLIVAELHPANADAALPASGFCVEAHRDPKRGIAATLIITNGTLHSGNAVLAGDAIAPVRIMEDHAGKSLKSASFSSPITLTGFDELPQAGAEFHTFKNKREAETAREPLRNNAPRAAATVTSTGERFMIPVVLRADAIGSLEAIEHEIKRLENEHSAIQLVQSGIGSISETDIKTAASNPENQALVVGFNASADVQAIERARQYKITIETFDIIYKLTERLEKLMQERTPKREVEEVLGRARVIKTFSQSKDVQVVGGKVNEGYLAQRAEVKIVRRKLVVGKGKITNLQSHKQNVQRVETESEFGAEVKADFEIAPGDVLECFAVTMK